MLDEKQKEEVEKEFDNAFNSLNEKTQNFIMGDEYVEIAKDIENKYQMSDEEGFTMETKTFYSLLGMISKEELKEILILTLRNRSAAEAEKIIKEVEDKILIHR